MQKYKNNIKILDVLQKNAILTNLLSDNKLDILSELITPISRIAGLNKNDLLNVLINREALATTNIGNGVGIPHCRFNKINDAIMGFGLSRNGVNFNSKDGKLVYIFFLLVTPEKLIKLHLKLLALITNLLKKTHFKKKAKKINDINELIKLIKKYDIET